MGGKRTVLTLSAAIVATLVCAGVASAAPPTAEAEPDPGLCSNLHPRLPKGIDDGLTGGQMIHPCRPT
jgi:hypothetical protein